MRKLVGLAVIGIWGALLPAQSSNGSIEISREFGVEQLVREFFIKGECKNVYNIQALGRPESLGFFGNGGSVLAIEDGIILSSGDVELAKGPNVSVETSATFNDSSSDPDLSLLATSGLFDVAGIEFDFIPLGAEVTFRYVFASEEYCEFVNTIFNDVFGFFVSGPGIDGPYADGAINVALVPNTDLEVSINTVNHQFNAESYIKNELVDDALQCGIPFAPNYLEQIEYDGFTVPLTARFAVEPCQTYHIRLVVGDVGDDQLDSGVFLKSQSFDLGETETVRAVVADSDEAIATEGCTTGAFVFKRPAGGGNTTDLTIDFLLDPAGTATEGVDFAPLPRSVVIPAGAGTVTLPVEILTDNQDEGVETLSIELLTVCDCLEGSRATLRISDLSGAEASLPTPEVCLGDRLTLRPTLTRGAPPFRYQWSNGATTASVDTLLTGPVEYQLTLTDACGQMATAATGIEPQPGPEVTAFAESPRCPGEADGRITLTAGGGLAPYRVTWNSDVADSFRPTGLAAGTYAYTVTDARGCSRQDTVAVAPPLALSSTCTNTDLYIPSAFSPNDDGTNDDFYLVLPAESALRTLVSVRIFDRWGELVFAGSGNPVAWDGTFRDRPLGTGVYLYTVVAEARDGSRRSYAGEVVLVR